MDHIEKALKRAREQKASDPAPAPQARAPQSQASQSRAPQPAAARRPSAGQESKRAPRPDTSFANTRVEPVGKRTLSEQRVIAGQVRDVCADTYRMLRAQVLFRLQELGGNTLGICSASPGEGKTLTAVNLAVSLALDPNYTVLLVDLDLRRPSASPRRGAEPVVDGLRAHGPHRSPDCGHRPRIETTPRVVRRSISRTGNGGWNPGGSPGRRERAVTRSRCRAPS